MKTLFAQRRRERRGFVAIDAANGPTQLTASKIVNDTSFALFISAFSASLREEFLL